MFDPDRFLINVQREDFPDLAPDEIEQLGKILQHPTMQKALSNTLRALMSTRIIFLSIHLDSISGISEMVKLQGRIEGYTGFVEALALVATRENSDEDQTNATSGIV
jgi:hypothetical protein